jgi:hypothetical protein
MNDLSMTPDATGQPVSQWLYRSRAVGAWGPQELRELLDQAQQRNARQELTGLLVFSQGCFVQWLEGAPEALDPVRESIQHDPRHTDVRTLYAPPHAQRLFPGWSMQLAVADGQAAKVDALPLPLPLLGTVAPAAHRGDAAAQFIEGIAFWKALPPIDEMTRALLDASSHRFEALITCVVALRPEPAALGWHLLTPLAQALSRAWHTEQGDATAVIVAQGRLQSLLRQVAQGWSLPVAGSAGRALVVPVPGEPHLVGQTFAALALDAAGWSVRCAFPGDAAALDALLRAEPYDMLHLASSDVMSREETLGTVAATIRAARRASRNPNLVVLVSGRMFSQQPGLAVFVGADGDGVGQASPSADFANLLSWVQTRRHSPAAMVAQATLNDVALELQRLRFGIAEEDAQREQRA